MDQEMDSAAERQKPTNKEQALRYSLRDRYQVEGHPRLCFWNGPVWKIVPTLEKALNNQP